MILVIDNYDSFTYNLVHLVGACTASIIVKRNDEITLEAIDELKPSGILISPGPGRPENAGICVDALKHCGPRVPILGVCLGHQAIGLAFGGTIVHAPYLMHGRTSTITHNDSPLFAGVRNPFSATRYHSLVISDKNFPTVLEIAAKTSDGIIMGVHHRVYPIWGVQFHPESILTEEGEKIIRNWLRMQK